MGATSIGRGTKIDNQVMVAHNCKIGEECLIVAQVAVAGSCIVGDRAVLAGQAGMSDHLVIGKDAILQGASGAMRDIEPGQVVAGTPAAPHTEFMKQTVLMRKLPDIYDDLRKLKKKVAELEAALNKAQPVTSGKES